MKNLIGTLLACLISLPAFSDWALDAEKSFIGFGSVKNDLIAENHYFKTVSGGVSADGNAAIVIPLASVETIIPIRNERMAALLFNVTDYPIATVNTALDLAKYMALKVGDAYMGEITVDINLHGIIVQKTMGVKVVRSSEDTFDVSNLGPVIVHASQFGLADGVDALRKIAGLQSIDLMVPVTFDLRLIKTAT